MIRALLAVPFLLVIVLFALSNQQAQRFSLWPTDLSVELPLSLAVLGVALVFFVAGGLLAWASVARLRHRLRRRERTISALEAQLATTRADIARRDAVRPAATSRTDLVLSTQD